MKYYQRLKDLRNDRDLKQEDIAEYLKISQTLYSRYELGKHMMGIDKYIELAKFYNVSLDYLAGIIDTPKTLDGKPYRITKNITIHNDGDNNNFNIKQ